MSGSGSGSERIGIFGGTFDPIHVGHLIVAADLRHALTLDRVLFVPAGRPPHKAADLVSADGDRLAMLELALATEPKAEISTVDLERPGPSYTVDLLAILRAGFPVARLVFLMGEDSLRDLPTWRNPDEIARLADFGVAARPGVAFDPEAVYAQVPAARGRLSLVETVQLSISSSDIRRRVRQGAPIRHLVPCAVEDYIAERGLYR
ncbi:MAG: nicotinate-nucleotide adenylyltransferase [Chloroflexia bacterium]|nr:nicotinate-nucleotide adenylyltransferase [Chloroflexia bacterium]